MDLLKKIEQQFSEHKLLLEASQVQCGAKLDTLIQHMIEVLTNDHKILVWGVGSSAALAQYFTSQLLGSFMRERPSFSAIALNSDAAVFNGLSMTYPLDEVVARQVRALGQLGDSLLIIFDQVPTFGIFEAIEAAKERDMSVMILAGRSLGEVQGLLSEGDDWICVPSAVNARIREQHLFFLHAICDGIDSTLFGDF